MEKEGVDRGVGDTGDRGSGKGGIGLMEDTDEQGTAGKLHRSARIPRT